MLRRRRADVHKLAHVPWQREIASTLPDARGIDLP
jgi:hypothetical protein